MSEFIPPSAPPGTLSISALPVEMSKENIASGTLDAFRRRLHAEILQALADLPDELAGLFVRLGDEALAGLLAEIDPFDAARLLGKLSRAQAADVVEEMEEGGRLSLYIRDPWHNTVELRLAAAS